MIYFLNFSYRPNIASENRLQGYYHALDKMDIKATVVYIHPDRNHSRVYTKYKNISIEYLWCPYMIYRGPFRRLTLFRYIRKFLKRLKEGDIVYTYSLSALTNMCEEVKGVKVFAERTEHPKASAGFGNSLLSLSGKEITETLTRLSGLFVISRPLKEYYESLGVPPSKIHIVNMTVDIDRFRNLKKTPSKERYIAYCGDLSNDKDGVNLLIKAFALVCRRIPDIKLYLIGATSSKDCSSNNFRLIKDLGIEDRVVFTGVVSSNKMPQLLKDAEVLALARPDNLQAKYGFPTKLGEYLLTENPVAVTSVGDIPLFLKDGISALISEPSNVDMFADKLLWALNNPDDASRIGKAGAEVAMRNFNSLIETGKIMNVICPSYKMPRHKKKVLFFLPSGVGGAERITITIAKMLPRDEYEIKFVIVSKNKGDIAEFIPDDIPIEYIILPNIWCFGTTRIYCLIRKEKPYAVFCSVMYLNCRVALAGHFMKAKVILRNCNYMKTIRPDQRLLCRLAYPYADAIISQQEEMSDDIVKSIGVKSEKVFTLHNPIDTETIAQRMKNAESPFQKQDDEKCFVWVGRFHETKGQDIAVEAFSKVHEQLPESHLYLIGRYDSNSSFFLHVQSLITKNKLTDYVHTPGFDANPYRWIAYADCFVLPSRIEGLPNTLIEAQYLGIPAAATRCIPIIERIIKEGINGYTAPSDNSDALADAMLKAICLKDVPMTYKSAGKNEFIKLFK